MAGGTQLVAASPNQGTGQLGQQQVVQVPGSVAGQQVVLTSTGQPGQQVMVAASGAPGHPGIGAHTISHTRYFYLFT